MTTIISAQNVQKYFGTNHVLKNINLEVNQGEVVCIIGPSGSGKSTFLRCINQLEKIEGGYIAINGEIAGYKQRENFLYPLSDREIAKQRRSVGMVFQRFNLFPHRTVLANITEGPICVQNRAPKSCRCNVSRRLDRSQGRNCHCTRKRTEAHARLRGRSGCLGNSTFAGSIVRQSINRERLNQVALVFQTNTAEFDCARP